MSREVICTVRPPLAVLTLNRPEKINALTLGMREQLADALVQCDADPQVQVVLLHGAGERGFCAGADLAEVGQRTAESELASSAEIRRAVPRLLERIGKPTIAVLHGFVLGAGLELALACTFRIAETNAVFGLPEVQRGVIPGSGGTQRLARVVGLGWAYELVLAGRQLDAREAYAIGLVTRIVNPGSGLVAGEELAMTLTKVSPRVMKLAKWAVYHASAGDLERGIDFERLAFALTVERSEAKP